MKQTLRERLQRQTQGSRYAEAAQAVTREKLAQETKAHQAAEAVRVETASELRAANAKLASTGEALDFSRKAGESRNGFADGQYAALASRRGTAEHRNRLAASRIHRDYGNGSTGRSNLCTEKSGRSGPAPQHQAHSRNHGDEKSAPIGPISAIEAPAIGAEERGPQTATEMSQLVPAASENRIIHVRKSGQPAEAIQ